MLVTFSCGSHENITMFGHVAEKLLHLMGNGGTVPGAILADDVPDALARLQQSIVNEASKPLVKPVDDEDDKEPEISLAKRAIPLIALLQYAVKHERHVMWDCG